METSALLTRYGGEFNFTDLKLINSYLRMVSYFLTSKHGCVQIFTDNETRPDAQDTRRAMRQKRDVTREKGSLIGHERYHGALTSCLTTTAVRYPAVFSTSPLLFGALMSRSAPLGVTNLRIVIKLTIERE